MKASALHSVDARRAERTDTQCMEAAQVQLVVFSDAQQIHISKMYTRTKRHQHTSWVYMDATHCVGNDDTLGARQMAFLVSGGGIK